ncbi:MAG TPA: glutamate--tRNA ligase [Alphaproteobacteria bacterium]|nr:glutamate--tRNA ligase [Alphaproteobacteria bacterium]
MTTPNPNIRVRFAPSPTGYLHIGGARTALYNWLFARHNGGTFLLRIEDTDRARSTKDAIDKIFEGLKWLELTSDEPEVFQFARMNRHAEVANKLLAEGKAYHCFATPEELTEMRERQKAEGKPMRYDGRWRDRDPKEAPTGAKPVVRLKAPTTGETIVRDLVQGEIRVANEQLDDMVLLRSDGTPTYMLSVVVDDHDMNISHVIRGQDHMTNTFRQRQLYEACGWTPPEFAHIPLIHGPDGAKLSKRHGALGVEAYRDMGFLPEAMCNYLLRLGWGHGDEEIVPRERAIELFDLSDVGRSPARFDMAKLTNLNAHYMRQADDTRLFALIRPMLEQKINGPLTAAAEARVRHMLPGLKERARTLIELADSAVFLVTPAPLPLTDKAAKTLGGDARTVLTGLAETLTRASAWEGPALEEATRQYAETSGKKLGDVAQPARAALTYSTVSPPIFDVMAALGREETLKRLTEAAAK